MKEPAEKESNPWFWIAISVAVVGFVSVAWLMSWDLITRQFGNPTGSGKFGDMFGAVNALFSGLAFAGVIVAILMQREELNLQRKELARSTKAQDAQERALVIAAQLNANAALLEHQNIIRASPDRLADVGWENNCIDDIFRLLGTLRDSPSGDL